MKVLVIRFSSIGDVVLTTPILRCLKEQKSCEVHYVVKKKYLQVLENNPHVDRFHTIERSVKKIITDLKKEQFDFVFDLQNNLNSFRIKKKINSVYFTVNKKNWQKFLLIYLRWNVLNDHVVDRYFECISKAGFHNDNKGLDHYLPSDLSVDYDISKSFAVWCLGASHHKKKLTKEQIVEVCNGMVTPVVLIGGPNEKAIAEEISKKTVHPFVTNLCGSISLNESAYLVKKSAFVLTNDTGIMHIAAAYQKKIVSFWGCTKPSIGFAPLVTPEKSKMLLSKKSNYPCSKHGKYCRYGCRGCIKDIHPQEISKVVAEMSQS